MKLWSVFEKRKVKYETTVGCELTARLGSFSYSYGPRSKSIMPAGLWRMPITDHLYSNLPLCFCNLIVTLRRTFFHFYCIYLIHVATEGTPSPQNVSQFFIRGRSGKKFMPWSEKMKMWSRPSWRDQWGNSSSWYNDLIQVPAPDFQHITCTNNCDRYNRWTLQKNLCNLESPPKKGQSLKITSYHLFFYHKSCFRFLSKIMMYKLLYK